MNTFKHWSRTDSPLPCGALKTNFFTMRSIKNQFLIINYDFLKGPQMELFKPRLRRTRAPGPVAAGPQTEASPSS
jgi:hypothetical protein